MLSLKRRTQQILLGSSFAITIGIASNANAETASSNLVVNAGLKEALSLTCDTPLSFGITSVNFSELKNDQTATVATDGNLTGTGGDGTAGIVSNDGTESAGQCIMSGSKAKDTTNVTVSYAATSIELAGDSTAFAGLDAPGSTTTTLTVDSFTESGNTVDTNGEATIKIGATLTIPSNLDTTSLGGYSGTVTVEVDDGFTG